MRRALARSNAEQILVWLRAAAPVPGFIGFAVGRTTFWDPLVGLRDGKMSRATYVQRVNTTGGLALASGCDASTVGQISRVPYTAKYFFYRAH